jgi:hypothetical protein
MLKKDEIANQSSCLNRSSEEEPVFVLRGADVTAPNIIREWVKQRIGWGRNKPEDSQIVEALALAIQMEAWRSAAVKCADCNTVLLTTQFRFCQSCAEQRYKEAVDVEGA